MKFSVLVFSVIASSIASVAASRVRTSKIDTSNFAADSRAARKLIEKSHRRTEDYFNEAYVAKHSVIYGGCHNNTYMDNENGGMIQQIEVTFDLCPTTYCNSGTCKVSATGTYRVGLETFLESYLEAKMEEKEYRCEVMKEECGCDEDGDDDCLYYCWKNYDDGLTWSECYEEYGEEQNYAVCDRLEIRDEEEEGDRRLNNNNNNYEYFIGPVCSADGEIHLSLYWDEDCTNVVRNAAKGYYNLAGTSMPYTDESLITAEDCTSCKEPKNDQNDDDAQDADEVTRMCEEIYTASAKCEQYGKYPDTTGCDYVNRNLMTSSTSATVSYPASFFFGGFVVAAIGATAFFIKRK
mmetsp:Transcript_5507/g.8393  ORF Transcript_5507/g.8393 Transcript_5507/m.8393 type:complete len:351 (-) Transcript_5507:170-1222(-)